MGTSEVALPAGFELETKPPSGFVLEKTATPEGFIPERRKTVMSESPLNAVGEVAAQMGTGLFGALAGTAAGTYESIRDMDVSKFEPAFTRESEPVTYQPRTVGGKVLSKMLAAPFKWFEETGAEQGQKTFESTGSPEAAITVQMGITAVPYTVGYGLGLRRPKVAEKPVVDPMLAAQPTVDLLTKEMQAGSPAKPVVPETIKPQEGQKVSKFSERAAVSQDVLPEHQIKMATGKERLYETQDMGTVENIVAGMDDAALAMVPLEAKAGQNNIWVAAQLERHQRAAKTNPDLAWQVLEQTMNAGTQMGQLINQLKLLKSATPESVVAVLNHRLKQSGYDPIPKNVAVDITKLSENSIEKNRAWRVAEREWRAKPTDANLEKVSQARMLAVEADVATQSAAHGWQPRAFSDVANTMLKGNLLAPISQVANFVGNTTNLPVRSSARSIAVVVDMMDSFIRNRPREITVSPITGTKEAGKNIFRSVPESWRSLYRGASDAELTKADARLGLQPLVAWKDLMSKNIAGPTKNGKTQFGDTLGKVMEASPMGMHATAQLRMLGAIDKPFANAARGRLIVEAARLRTLNGDPITAPVGDVVKFPELFFDRKTLDRIEHETQKAVYTNPNFLTEALARANAKAKPSTRFWVSTIQPYVTTPTNVVGEWLSYNPAIAAVNAVRLAKKGDIRGAEMSIGKFVVGSTVLTAGVYLYNKGIITPTLEQKSEQQKGRMLSQASFPQGRINITALGRLLDGKDPSFKDGDETLDIIRGGGVTGALLLNAADLMRQQELSPVQTEAKDLFLNVLGNEATLTLGYGVNQSMMRGVATLLSSIVGGQTEKWFESYTETLAAPMLPNTLTAISRATRDYKPEVRDDKLDQQLENQIRNKLGLFGLDKNLPLKHDLFGRRIKETPDGESPLLYQFLDITKSRKIPSEPLPLYLYQLWRRTASHEVIPTPPDKSLTLKGTTFNLTPEQVGRLREITGEQHYAIGSKIIENENFYSLPDEHQIKYLKRAWRKGTEDGKKLFIEETLRTQGMSGLQIKPQRQGFTPSLPDGFESQ